LVAAGLWLLGVAATRAEDNTVQILDGTVTNISGAFYVGQTGTSNLLFLRNGGRITSGSGNIGHNATAWFNAAWVIGTGSVWSNNSMYVGVDGAYNRLTITNGGRVVSGSSLSAVGYAARGTNNEVVVTDPGSLWSLGTTLYCGYNGSGGRLTVTNGGAVSASALSVGSQSTASNNAVVLTGPGSSLTTTFSATVGDKGPGNQLELWDDAELASSGLLIGQGTGAISNVVSIVGGSYRMNPSSSSPLEVRRGQLVLSNGTISVVGPSLLMTNAGGTFQFLAGTCTLSRATVSNGLPFVVGDGIHNATLQLQAGAYNFANGLEVASNAEAQTIASGSSVVTLSGAVTNFGTVEFGGRLMCSNVLVNAGTMILDGGATANFYGPVINNGVINSLLGTGNFYGGLTGTGKVLSADGDDDHDGVTNLEEARAGTDPLNPNSFFHVIAVGRNGGDVQLTVLCGGGRTNQLEYAATPGGPYTSLGAPVILKGTGDVITNLIAPGVLNNETQGYFRVRLSPP
jgi:T5SS/PEP-CTERM-associated repeat protein